MKILKNRCVIQKKAAYRRLLWSHQGLNLGPPDYESGATNQLSYRTKNLQWFGVVTEPHCKYNVFFDIFD